MVRWHELERRGYFGVLLGVVGIVERVQSADLFRLVSLEIHPKLSVPKCEFGIPGSPKTSKLVFDERERRPI